MDLGNKALGLDPREASSLNIEPNQEEIIQLSHWGGMLDRNAVIRKQSKNQDNGITTN